MKTVEKFKSLPKMKPSQLLRLALADLAKVERHKKQYRVDMYDWHGPGGFWGGAAGQCAVCLAGSVMAKTLGCAPTCRLGPAFFNNRTRDYLLALESFRSGQIDHGVRLMLPANRVPKDLPGWQETSRYSSADPKPFKRSMRQIVALLERRGI